jgi:hypothetical protein
MINLRFQIITLILSGIGFGKATCKAKALTYLTFCIGAATVELVSLSQIKPFIEVEWGVSTANLSKMSSATFLGEIVGGLIWSFASDRIGKSCFRSV